MSKQIIGTCGICGGRVTVPSPYWSVIPPVPSCESCGAQVAQHGPVLPMNPAPRREVVTTQTTISYDWQGGQLNHKREETE